MGIAGGDGGEGVRLDRVADDYGVAGGRGVGCGQRLGAAVCSDGPAAVVHPGGRECRIRGGFAVGADRHGSGFVGVLRVGRRMRRSTADRREDAGHEQRREGRRERSRPGTRQTATAPRFYRITSRGGGGGVIADLASERSKRADSAVLRELGAARRWHRSAPPVRAPRPHPTRRVLHSAVRWVLSAGVNAPKLRSGPGGVAHVCGAARIGT